MNKSKSEKPSLAEKIDKIYSSLKQEHTLDLVLYYFKTSIIHIGFEAVITVLYVAPLVLYSASVSQQAVSLPLFFGKVLLQCSLIFSIVVVAYLFSLFLYILISLIKIDVAKIEIFKHIRKVSWFGIIAGIIVYFAGGVSVANHPEWFSGMESIKLSSTEMYKVAIRITVIGLIWAFQSTMRYKRVATIIRKPVTKSVYTKLQSVTVQIFVMCVIAFLLLYAFKRIPSPSEMFDYYNLLLVIYFSVYSAYVTACYKLEIKGQFPGEL